MYILSEQAQNLKNLLTDPRFYIVQSVVERLKRNSPDLAGFFATTPSYLVGLFDYHPAVTPTLDTFSVFSPPGEIKADPERLLGAQAYERAQAEIFMEHYGRVMRADVNRPDCDLSNGIESLNPLFFNPYVLYAALWPWQELVDERVAKKLVPVDYISPISGKLDIYLMEVGKLLESHEGEAINIVFEFAPFTPDFTIPALTGGRILSQQWLEVCELMLTYYADQKPSIGLSEIAAQYWPRVREMRRINAGEVRAEFRSLLGSGKDVSLDIQGWQAQNLLNTRYFVPQGRARRTVSW